jgi:Phosphodiester glycosidase
LLACSCTQATPSAEHAPDQAEAPAAEARNGGSARTKSSVDATHVAANPAGSPSAAGSNRGVATPGAAPSASAPDTSGRASQPHFPPLAFTPPFEATAAEGDGQWRPLGDPALSESAAQSPPFVVQAVVHPHKQKRFVSMHVVAIDLTALKLSWVVGSKDLHAEKLAAHQTPGLVPTRDQENAVLVFNGGFQARHGWWGMMSDGVTLVDPKPHGCTLAIFGDETVRIAPYSELADERPRMQAFRQSPPCLLHNGEVHPNLLKGNLKSWAGQTADLKTRRRSAVGSSADGKTLYFAIGNETEAVDLARGLSAVGATVGMQLDINWAWARLLLVGRVDGQPRLTSSLLPDALYGKSECFARPSERDFFYLSR